MSRLTFDDLTPDDMPAPYVDDSGDRADAYRDSLLDCGTQTTEAVPMNIELVPVPTRAVRSASIRSNDAARPYVGMYVEALHKWFVDVDLDSVVAAFCCERDEGTGGEMVRGYGASEIGCEFPLYFMGTGTANKRRVGSVFYNGNVKLDEVLS